MKSQRNGKSSTIPERILGDSRGMFQIAEQGLKRAILQFHVFYSKE
jgi:hypothetical protein